MFQLDPTQLVFSTPFCLLLCLLTETTGELGCAFEVYVMGSALLREARVADCLSASFALKLALLDHWGR